MGSIEFALSILCLLAGWPATVKPKLGGIPGAWENQSRPSQPQSSHTYYCIVLLYRLLDLLNASQPIWGWRENRAPKSPTIGTGMGASDHCPCGSWPIPRGSNLHSRWVLTADPARARNKAYLTGASSHHCLDLCCQTLSLHRGMNHVC